MQLLSRGQLAMRMTLASVIVAAFGLSSPAWGAGAPLHTERLAPELTVEQLTPNVYAFISNNTTHVWEDGNSVAIIGDTCVAVVDAPANYLAKRHLAEIKKITNKPICYLVNTHFHRDHTLGDYVYKDAFPNLVIVQQDYTAKLADRRNPSMFDAVKGTDLTTQMKQLQDEAATGKGSDGKPFTPFELERAKRTYDEIALVAAAAPETRFVPADITFDDAMTLKLGGTEARLIHLPGHTEGDTAVWLPKERIMIAGDLVIAPVPYGGGISHYDAWADTLDKLMQYDAAAIVPGHGEVEFDQNYVRLQRDLFRALMAQAVAAVKSNESLADFKKSLDLSSFEKQLVHGDPELQWGWDNYFFGKTNNALAIQAYLRARGDT